MHQYLLDTNFASEQIIELIGKEKREIEVLKPKYDLAKGLEANFYREFLIADNSDDGRYERINFYYSEFYKSSKEAKELKREIEILETSIINKNASIDALCTALLQLAKQGISIVHGGLNSCPDGRSIGTTEV